jgi:hypothetical protein
MRSHVLTKKEAIVRYVTVLTVCFFALYVILPMILLGKDYIFTIHDGLDSYAGMVQMIYEKHLYFHMNQKMPVMNGMDGKYFFMTYTLYDFLNCMLGFVTGQICTRIISVFLGFFSMEYLLKRIFPLRNSIETDLIYLISIAYAITPCAPNRSIAYASLPCVVYLFLELAERRKFSYLVFWVCLCPIFSCFDAVLIFVIILWFLFALILCLKDKKINVNLVAALLLMSVSAILVNMNYVRIAFCAGETNRRLLTIGDNIFSWKLLKDFLLNGQYHAPALHGYLLLPVILIGISYALFQYGKDRKNVESKYIISFLAGLFLWFFSAFIKAFQESGFGVGILLIDGVGWGRSVELMRIVWYLILAALIFLVPSKRKFNKAGVVLGLLILGGLMWGMLFYFREAGYPAGRILINQESLNRCLKYLRIVILLIFSVGLFSGISKKILNLTLYGLLLFQLSYIAVANTTYNDTGITVVSRAFHLQNDETINFREFFSEDLFQEIQEDIHYKNEGVAAYGYHPSVLLYNGFNTLDGYLTVHSMESQLQFREIIAPTLEQVESWKDYYDGWGGRMYLYGELYYGPTRNKETEPTPLYIDVEAFKRHGGTYILSRAEIANSKELGITLVKDYDRENSLYHIYLYKV